MNTIRLKQVSSLLEEEDMIASLANLSAFIMTEYQNLNWAGFYFVKNNELILGPFQGKIACTHIPFNKGVCGKCYRTKQAQRVDDVLAIQDHIACDSASRSELCVPVLVNDEVMLEIDLDSFLPARFTEEDEKEMLQIAQLITNAFLQHQWVI